MQKFYEGLLAAAALKKGPPKILCVGKNYLKHAIEMGGTEVPKKPVVFLKPHSSILPAGSPIILPKNGNEIHHEIELGFIIGKPGKFIAKENWREHVGGYFLALDLTDRTEQAICKKAGMPWSVAKGQDTFMPLSNFVEIEKVKEPHNLELELTINGETKQKTNTGEMHFKIPDIIEYTSTVFQLQEGDMFLTGTPEGVGKIVDGDLVEATLRQEGELIAKISHIASLDGSKPGEKEESKSED